MLQPRFAINVFGIGGVVFLLVGLGMFGAAFAVAGDAGTVFWILGPTFTASGALWTWFAGRWGPLGDSSSLLANGRRCQAQVLAWEATGAATTTGDGPNASVTGRVYRLDLAILDTGVQVRVYRYLRGDKTFALAVAKQLDVAVDPSDPRRVAIDWSRAPTPASFAQQAQSHAHAAQQQAMAAIGMHAHPMLLAQRHAMAAANATESATILTATQIASGSNGEPVLELVAEVRQNGVPTYARGTVRGPSGGAATPGRQVQVELDASRTAIVNVHW